MVSRTGFLAVENVSGFANLTAKEQTAFRIVCGSVAGMGFGLDGCFWRRAVIPDQWNFNVCLFGLVLSLLTRWFFTPEQKRSLYLAALTEGLLLGDSQTLFPTAYAFPLLLALGRNPNVGRDIIFLESLFFYFILTNRDHLWLIDAWLNQSTSTWEFVVTALIVFAWILLVVITRKFLSEWKTVISCAFLFLIGVGAYFLLAPFSMADPPMNWGYPRTIWYFLAVSRGQYCSTVYTGNIEDLLPQWRIYGKIAIEQFGVVYLVAAAIPLFFLVGMRPLVQRWILAMSTIWFLVSQLIIAVVDTSQSILSYESNETSVAATHFVLAILAGCGFMVAGAYGARSSKREPRPLRGQC
jgi:hypothetical protein